MITRYSLIFLIMLVSISGISCGQFGVDKNFQVFTDTISPSNISNLNIVSGVNELSLTWTDPVDKTFSKVIISCDQPEINPVIVKRGTEQYTFSGLEIEKLYTFSITSYDTAGNASGETTTSGNPMGKMTYSAGSISVNMASVPHKIFYKGTDDGTTATVPATFYLADIEVTYSLWSTVYSWATDNTIDHDGDGLTGAADGDDDIYVFANPGGRGGYMPTQFTMGSFADGHENHPVTYVNWRDAIVWCNALTEYYNRNNSANLSCVYFSDENYTVPIRTSTNTDSYDLTEGSEDTPYIFSSSPENISMDNCTSKGFRLPTSDEWELAARFINDFNNDGDILDIGEYYPGDHASGDSTTYCFPDDVSVSSVFGNYAWYADNSTDIEAWGSTHPVATAGTVLGAPYTGTSNALGIYDMSGNVIEWHFDFIDTYTTSNPDTTNRYKKFYGGGSFNDTQSTLQVGYIYYYFNPFWKYMKNGFRVAKSIQ